MKFKLLERESTGLCRIQALKDFGDVKAGTIGGYVASEQNLSQDGDCWIYDNAIVCDNAIVHGNARVYDNALVCDNAIVCDDASVYGNVRLYGDAIVYDNARVYGNARVYDDVSISDNAIVYDNARIYGKAGIYGNARVCDNAIVCSDASVHGDAIVCGNATVTKDPINILGLGYRVTITDNHIQIGYKQFTLEQALMLEYKELEHLKDVIIPLIKLRMEGKI